MRFIRKLFILCVLITVSVIAAVSANAIIVFDTIASGTCGDNLTWKLNSSCLTISGTGPMYDYSPENPAPWFSEDIGNLSASYVTIEHGVTSIGDYAFSGWINLHHVDVPSTVQRIGHRAFWVITNGFNLYFFGDAPQIQGNPFPQEKFFIITYRNWDDSTKENFPSYVVWNKGRPQITPGELCTFPLNYKFTKDSFEYFVHTWGYITYYPDEVTFGPYDNSTYGYKQVEFTVDGNPYTLEYFISDNNNHLDLIEVECDTVINYNEKITYKVQADGLILKEGTHYQLSKYNFDHAGTDGYVVFTGIGVFSGFKKTVPVAILKSDISDAVLSIYVNSGRGKTIDGLLNMEYTGMPITLSVELRVAPLSTVIKHTDYIVSYENNINIGTATIRIIGRNNYYGEKIRQFKICNGLGNDLPQTIKGSYNGTVDNITNENFYYEERVIPPGKCAFKLSDYNAYYATYMLYRIDENEEAELIQEVSDYTDTFTYDFTSVYEGATEQGGEIYLLAYSWVTYSGQVYSGSLLMLVPAKCAEATGFIVYVEDEDGDCYTEYFSAVGDDGTLSDLRWSVSDPSVASIENGTMTLKKPGTITLSVENNGVVADILWEIAALDLSGGSIFEYYPKSQSVVVIYDGRVLDENVHYTLSKSINGDFVEVSVTGCGLFSGQLTRTFHLGSGEPVDHTHEFDNACDNTCNLCPYNRSVYHEFTDKWVCDKEHHWKQCTLCGRKELSSSHRVAYTGAGYCHICNYSPLAADFTEDGIVNTSDVEYLLMYTLFPEDYPVKSYVDYSKDGKIDASDVEHLLMYTLYPEDYPI